MHNSQLHRIYDHQNEKSRQTSNALNILITSENTICFQLSSVINVTTIKISFHQFWLWRCWTIIILNIIPNCSYQISDNCWEDWEDYEIYGASPFSVEYPECLEKQTGELFNPSNNIHKFKRQKMYYFCWNKNIIYQRHYLIKIFDKNNMLIYHILFFKRNKHDYIWRKRDYLTYFDIFIKKEILF